MLRCIAIDDEDMALELMEDYISKVPYLKLVALFDDPVEAMNMIEQQQIDLVFLDIQMPELTGLQLIQSLSNKPLFVLVTAYEKYALESYNLNVVDYLLKPVPFDRFVKASNKARELFLLKNKTVEHPKEEEQDHIFVYVDYSHVKVNFDDIMWVEGLKDYIKIRLKSTSKPVIARISMRTIEEQLPSSRFIRIQKSYIVSRAHISVVKKNSVFVGGTELTIGENYKEAVQRLLNYEV